MPKKLTYESKTCVNWKPYPLETDGSCSIGKMPKVQVEELNWDWEERPKFISCAEGNPQCSFYVAEGKIIKGRPGIREGAFFKDEDSCHGISSML